VKAYFALKMIGDSVDADHMRRAREAVLARGGAERANVFTRIMLALFGFIPWRAVPVIPVEVMLLPKWFPFHLDKISYWSRTVIVPLLVLMVKKPRARNAKGVRIDELFAAPPRSIGPTPKAPQQKATWFWFFRGVDNVLRSTEPFFPKASRQRAIDSAVAWTIEHLNGEEGVGAIFPAMANTVMMFDVLGYPQIIRTAPSPASRSRSSWWCTSRRLTASRAFRRSGTPASPVMRCWKSAASA
jgi:Squalene cyclase